ncbi:biphenyl-2,3-diol 1,2-dioxygenase III-related protein [hydrothermal vent metagenome]|uniref:Biphenyl-2,3-diol 1,2-dioxygenase III-related protein n=1 Tax=hydrothermal vent metagenome TaxID=652676 RepID=A0A3B0XNP7_9ZZZZ
MLIQQLDHLVLTVKDMPASIAFYTHILGMQAIEFANGRKALSFGTQKINLHPQHRELKPCAETPTPGSADLCFIVQSPVSEMLAELQQKNIPIETGPVKRSGATGPILSIYIRDPDNNLIELSNRI